MPILAYKCADCENEFEVFYTSFSAQDREEPTETCPKCDSLNKEKMLPSKTNFQLKGRGWFSPGINGGKKNGRG